MIRVATVEDLPALTRLLAASNHTPYDVTRVAAEKLFGRGAYGEAAVTIDENGGAIDGVAVQTGRFLRLIAVHPAARRRGIATRLLSDRVSVAFAEPGNYLTPGVSASDEVTLAFLRSRGFRVTAETHNLETGELPPGTPEEVVRVTHERAPEALAFVEREFGRLWRFEAELAMENDPPTLFVTESGGAITGFAAHEANNRGLGTFGPTGVAKAHRGSGLGSRLLAASLADLRRLGHSKAIVPWTDAMAFYRKACNAREAARFLTLERPV